MPITDFYRIQKPSKWASIPHLFSYSSLNAIKQCPLQWQLAHSKYGESLEPYPFRPAPAAVEGRIVHNVLELLFRALSLRGLPKIESQEFRQCIQEIRIKDRVETLAEEHAEKITAHPRGNGFRLKLTTQQLTNKVIRVFRQQYPQMLSTGIEIPAMPNNVDEDSGSSSGQTSSQLLEKYGVLSEHRLEHPNLPFMGVLDLVFLSGDETVIVDFKTGTKDEGHMRQLLYYAVLWWRNADQIPERIELRYPSEIVSIRPDNKSLEAAEQKLAQEIHSAVHALSKIPSKSKSAEHCGYCDVRQFCESYWQYRESINIENIHSNTAMDLEVTILDEPNKHGFQAKTRAEELAVVLDSGCASIFDPFQTGERLRILGGYYKSELNALELKAWSEVFRF